MTIICTTKRASSRDWGNGIAHTSKRKAHANLHGADKALSRGGQKKQCFSFGISKSFLIFIFGLVLFVCGGFYIYEINTLATKGYEIRELENRVGELTRESRQLKIQEVELRSMYAIEKSMKDLNLVSVLSNVSYIEMDGPIAMK